MSAVEKEPWEDETGSVLGRFTVLLLLLVLLCSALNVFAALWLRKWLHFIPVVILPSCKNKNKLMHIASMSQHLDSNNDDNGSYSLHEIMNRQSEESKEWEIASVRDPQSMLYFCLQVKKINGCYYDSLQQLRICPNLSTATQLPQGSK